jgi:hypothetical protein
MYRGSFPGGFPPNFQGPLHGPPRPRFPYPPENRWAIFAVHCCALYRFFFNEMDIKISKHWNQWNSEKLCVVFYWLLLDICIFHEVWLEVNFLVRLLNVQSWMQCLLLLCLCLCLSHSTVLNRGAFFLPIE